MASEETVATVSPMQQQQKLVVDYLTHTSTGAVGPDDETMYYGDGSEPDVDDDDDHMGLQMSGLSIQSSETDGSAESSEPKKTKKKDTTSDEEEEEDEDDGIITVTVRYYNGDLSLPGSPARSSPARYLVSGPACLKEYASETEARAPGGRKGGGGDRTSSYYWRNSRRARESRLERTWEMRRCHCTGDDSHSGGSSPCVVVRTRGGGAACMCMDMDEVRACRDLGLELPSDWTVEIPPAAFQQHHDTSSGGDSPVGSWHTFSPRDDPTDVKARLRVWAQAVALASRLGS